MPFVVFPPPSHKLHLGSPRGGDGTRSLRERADRRTGTSLPSSARVRQATCPSNVALVGNQDRAGPPGLSLVTTKTIPTYRTRGPRREAAPTPPPGRWPACTSRGWPDILQKQVRACRAARGPRGARVDQGLGLGGVYASTAPGSAFWRLTALVHPSSAMLRGVVLEASLARKSCGSSHANATSQLHRDWWLGTTGECTPPILS